MEIDPLPRAWRRSAEPGETTLPWIPRFRGRGVWESWGHQRALEEALRRRDRPMAFEIMDRAAAGRLGKFTTPHGAVTTPTLMPVINPNLQLFTARQMREKFGAQMVI